jgi:hypothetical protein
VTTPHPHVGETDGHLFHDLMDDCHSSALAVLNRRQIAPIADAAAFVSVSMEPTELPIGP